MLSLHRRTSRLLVTLAAAAAVVPLAGGVAAAGLPMSATVSVTDAGYSPAAVSVAYGGRVTWLVKQGTHTVTDATRMHQYTSGTKSAGASFVHRFINSGTFPYHSVVGGTMQGKVIVPMTVTPSTGTRTDFFAVRWGSTYSPTGYSEQIQIQEPRSTTWALFVYGTPASNATFRPVEWGNKTGVYHFRAKLFKGTNPAVCSGWSPLASVTAR
jgi:plastocyanin